VTKNTLVGMASAPIAEKRRQVGELDRRSGEVMRAVAQELLTAGGDEAVADAGDRFAPFVPPRHLPVHSPLSSTSRRRPRTRIDGENVGRSTLPSNVQFAPLLALVETL
jgi:hypothetical protein